MQAYRASSGNRRVTPLRALLVLLVIVLASWLIIRHENVPVDRFENTSLLDRPIDEPEFAQEATTDQLLLLAEREIQRVLDRFPNSPPALNVKARRDFLLSDTMGAEAAWTEAVRLDPLYAEGLYGLALLAFEKNRYTDAIALCEDIVRLSLGDPRVVLLLADSLLHNGQAKEAILTLEHHMLNEQTTVQAWELLGSAHLQEQDFAKAANCYERALSYAPKSRDALYGMSQALTQLGESKRAAEYSQQFAGLAKSRGDESSDGAKAFVDRNYAAHVAALVYFDGARAAKQEGDLELAQSLLLRALRLESDVIEWLDELQRVLQAQGRKMDEVEVGRRLASLAPTNVERWLNLGGMYASLEMHKQAIEAYQKAVELSPNDDRCRRIQATLKGMR